jgi:hypothetical protein
MDYWWINAGDWGIYISVLVLSVCNVLLSLFYARKGNRLLFKTYLLSSLIVAIIGGSSCVSIRINKKKREPTEEKKKPVAFYKSHRKTGIFIIF